MASQPRGDLMVQPLEVITLKQEQRQTQQKTKKICKNERIITGITTYIAVVKFKS